MLTTCGATKPTTSRKKAKELSRSTALSATNHAGLGMTLEVTLVDPVPSGVAIRRARLTRRDCLMFRFVFGLRSARLFLRYDAEEGKEIAKP